MDALFLFAMFLVGIAAGSGIVWLLFRNAVTAAREQERVACITEIKVAEAQAAAKEEANAELRTTIGQKDAQLQQRNEEFIQLKQQQAVLQTTLKKEQEKIEEKIKLLGDAEQHFKDTFEALAAKALKENNVEYDKLSKPVRDTLSDISGKIAVVNSSAQRFERRDVEACQSAATSRSPRTMGRNALAPRRGSDRHDRSLRFSRTTSDRR